MRSEGCENHVLQVVLAERLREHRRAQGAEAGLSNLPINGVVELTSPLVSPVSFNLLSWFALESAIPDTGYQTLYRHNLRSTQSSVAVIRIENLLYIYSDQHLRAGNVGKFGDRSLIHSRECIDARWRRPGCGRAAPNLIAEIRLIALE